MTVMETSEKHTTSTDNEELNLEAIKAAAQQGDMEAQFQMGDYYRKVARNADDEEDKVRAMQECAKWCKKAASQGHIKSMVILGEIYECGIGMDKDYGKAATWYKKVADEGYITGMSHLADLYSDEEEFEKAVIWYRIAAEEGDVTGMFRLADLYSDEEEFEKAARWFRKAADKGDADSQYRLAGCYHYGKGVEKDKAEAYQWYLKAAEQEHPEALRTIQKMR